MEMTIFCNLNSQRLGNSWGQLMRLGQGGGHLFNFTYGQSMIGFFLLYSIDKWIHISVRYAVELTIHPCKTKDHLQDDYY